MGLVKRWVSAFLAGAVVFCGMPVQAQAAPEIVAGNYEIDMERIPQVHFAEHKNWEYLYQTAWESHKSNIREVSKGLNPELTTDEKQSYYVDEAFDDRIFQWDTLFMMLFDKYGLHEFPTLNSMDNFYYHQYDTEDESDGFISRMIYEADGRDHYQDYRNVDAINPPMFAWAEWEQYKIHGDIERFLKTVKGKPIIDRLDSYYQFIKRTRRHKTGPAAGLYVSNGQGSGLDNTPDQDYQGWGQAVKDMSFQQVQAAVYLQLIAAEILEKKTGLTADERQKYEDLKEKYKQEEEELTALIQEKLWSEEKGCFFNMDSRTGELKDVVTPMAFWSLAAGVATKEQADRMIEGYAFNSNKMFRPYGLSTVCYDYPSFKSSGGYWNGAMWSPASFQWLKGLQNYGYDAIAFEEAVRHVNGMADVCSKGAYDRNGNFLHTLWENYSTEYAMPGSTEFSDTQPARANFVGWAGAIGIGSLIEDIMGITIKGNENVIEWKIRLTEAFGIDHLYFNGPNGENFVDLACAERVSASSGAKLTIKAEHAFKLCVSVGGHSETIQVEAGEHQYLVDGTDGRESYLGIKTTKAPEKYFTADQMKKADSAVSFGAEGNSSRQDGLPGQIESGNGRIFNVNTVGHYRTNGSYPTELRDSAVMKSFGTKDAMEYVKATSPFGAEGFMFLVPASNSMQTVKVLVGVKNGTAEVEADLLDASELTEAVKLQGGSEESVYAVEIPNCAAGETNMMVTIAMEETGGVQGEVSLKAILLENDGKEVLQAPEDVSAVSADTALMVNARAPEGTKYDGYRIYYKKRDAYEWQTKETSGMPFLLQGLENFNRYDIFVTGVKDGRESTDSQTVSQIPEQTVQTDAKRAYQDWIRVQEQVLNGNEAFSQVADDLNFNVGGTTYGTTFTFSSNSHLAKYGLRNDGTVVNPILPQKNLETVLKVTAVCGDTKITITVPLTVLAVTSEEIPDPDDSDTQVKFMQTAQPQTVNLTEEGSMDWKLFTQTDLARIERKANGSGISNLSAIQEVTKQNGDPSDAVFHYTDGSGNPEGAYNKGIVFEKEGNGIRFDLPYRQGRQKAGIYLGAWSAKVKINAAVMKEDRIVKEYTEYFDTGKLDSNAPAVYQTVYLDYSLEDPDAILRVELSNAVLYDSTWGNFNLGAITLNGSFFAEAEAAEHGTLIITNPIASAGEEVTVFAVPDEGYCLKPGSLRYCRKEDGQETLIEGESFYMPAGDVTVKADLIKERAPLATSITVSLERSVLAVGERTKAMARIVPEDAVKTVVWSSSNQAVATINADGVITAAGEGTAKITAAAADESGISQSVNLTVTQGKKPVLGNVYESGGYRYKITNLEKKTAEAVGSSSKKMKHITVPDYATILGQRYQVTAVGPKAFRNCKQASKAVIGKYVVKIGKQAFEGCTAMKKAALKSSKLTEIGSKAFYRCKALRTVTVKSKKLKKVGKHAFKGIHKHAVCKAPAGKRASYRKLLGWK